MAAGEMGVQASLSVVPGRLPAGRTPRGQPRTKALIRPWVSELHGGDNAERLLKGQ